MSGFGDIWPLAFASMEQIQARVQEAWHEGHQAGFRRANRDRSKPRTSKCAVCGGPFEYTDDELDRLRTLAFDDEHKRELWRAHCAGVHGHPMGVAT